MSVKLLGGFAKGFVVKAPSTFITRPTSVMLKRKLFDRYQTLEGVQFFDICAGSGSIGLEAVSRGAEQVIFIESNSAACDALKFNLSNFVDKFGVPPKINKILKKNFLKVDFAELIDLSRRQFFFFDPPYERLDLYQQFFALLPTLNLSNAVVILEGCEQKTLKMKDFDRKFPNPLKFLTQGTHYFALYEF